MARLKQSTREEVLDRDGRECKFCGLSEEEHREEYEQSLEVHHIIPRRAEGSNKRTNLVSVCISCHRTLEHTQGKALRRLKREVMEERDDGLREENERLERLVETLIGEIHFIERLLRDEEMYKYAIGHNSIQAEVVTEKFGTDSVVTSDSERAFECYQDWGSSIKRTTLGIEDADEIVEDIRERISTIRARRHSSR